MRIVSEPDPRTPAGQHAPEPREASVLDVAKAVFWSFLGIRKRAAHEKDFVTLKPVQVIIAGIIGALILVLSIVTLVHIVTS